MPTIYTPTKVYHGTAHIFFHRESVFKIEGRSESVQIYRSNYDAKKSFRIDKIKYKFQNLPYGLLQKHFPREITGAYPMGGTSFKEVKAGGAISINEVYDANKSSVKLVNLASNFAALESSILSIGEREEWLLMKVNDCTTMRDYEDTDVTILLLGQFKERAPGEV